MKTNVTIEKVSPQLASEWLEEMWPGQRVLRKKYVDRLAEDMNLSQFKVGPDAIVRIKGKLANGQHRLEAVVRSGKTQSFLVLESDDDDLYKVIDSGLKRTASDGIMGMMHAKSIPSVARWVLAYERGTIYKGGNSGYSKNLSQLQVINYCIENKDMLSEAVTFANPLYCKTKLLSLSIASAMHALASKVSSEALVSCRSFLIGVYIDGGQNAAGDLRNRLIEHAKTKLKQRPTYIFAITAKAFRAYRSGVRAAKLSWRDGEELAEII